MSERNRDGFFPLVVMVLAGLVFALGHWAGSYHQYHRAPDEQREADASGEPLNKTTFWRVHSGSTKSYQTICDQPIDETQADLCQQWRSAQKAEEIAGYTLVSIFVGFAGLAGLAFTVQYAREAATAAHRSAAKATVANKIARESAERQLRAYVTVDSFDLDLTGPLPVGIAAIRNTGHTPAKELRFRVTFAPDGVEPKTHLRVDRSVGASVVDLGSNGSPYRLTQTWGAFTGQYRTDVLRRVAFGWFYGVVEYKGRVRDRTLHLVQVSDFRPSKQWPRIAYRKRREREYLAPARTAPPRSLNAPLVRLIHKAA
jgi:hypothetical protein